MAFNVWKRENSDHAGGAVTLAQAAPARLAPAAARVWTRHPWVVPVGIFLLSRVVDAVLIAVAARDQVARDPVVGVVDTPAGDHPGYLAALSNWDGQWYSQIAHHGYPAELPREDGVVQQNAWAYYPLYPGLVRLLMSLFRLPFEVAATSVSLVAGVAAMVVLFRLVDRVGGRFNATTTVTAVCLFPAAPVFQAAYTESLALLLVLLSLTALRDRRFGWLAVTTALLAFTRPVVLPLAAVIALHGLVRWRRRHTEPLPRREAWGYVATAAFAVLSFGLWPVATGLGTGEAGAYFATQKAWIIDGSSGWVSWLAYVSEPGLRGRAVVGVLVLVGITALVWRRAARAWGTELRLWGPVYFLYLLGSTRATSSIFRYAVLTVVPAWPGLVRPDREVSRRTWVAALLTMLVVGVALQYLWLRWFYVPHPGNHGYP